VRQKVLDEWIQRVLAGWGPRAAASARRIAPLLVDWQPLADLRAAGYRFARDNYSLEETLDILRMLGRSANSALRERLESIEAITALTSGWADGALSREQLSRRLAPTDMLRVRLRQHFQLANELNADPAQYAALLVVDPGSEMSVAVIEAIAAHIHQVFDSGETVASGAGNTIVSLVSRTPTLPMDAARLASLLRSDDLLRNIDIRVWIEPIGANADLVDAHLDSLAS
jgi:hypothetical protein